MAHFGFFTAALSLALVLPTVLAPCDPPDPDADGDGYPADVDCDDTDPTIHPDQMEPCICDEIDQNCNGIQDDFPCDMVCPDPVEDADGDGWTTPKDCDDTDPSVYPGAIEPCTCDGIDQDCNGQIDDFPCDRLPCMDGDGDGYVEGVDCNDNDPKINPGAVEPCKCDDIDQDCSGDPIDFPCDLACPGQGGQVGEACGGNYGDCADGLVCCYPCGIEGCEPNICFEPCFDEWCAGGCPMFP